ncbi:MAG: hypothetical protein EX285_07765 [Thaumarchaeota archaeon]|nr:hypothetical protein [Nitrososphaerota archaeon]
MSPFFFFFMFPFCIYIKILLFSFLFPFFKYVYHIFLIIFTFYCNNMFFIRSCFLNKCMKSQIFIKIHVQLFDLS